jgi:hypothetical protein
MPYYLDPISYALGKLVERINLLTDYNISLLDQNSQLIKNALLTDVYVASSDASKVFIVFVFNDATSDEYTVRHVAIWWRDLSESRQVCYMHTLSQNYTKPADKTLQITIKAGFSIV